MPESPRPIILRPGLGRSIDLGNFATSVKATGEQTCGSFTLLLIGATALQLSAQLATLNVRHFPMFPGLEAPY